MNFEVGRHYIYMATPQNAVIKFKVLDINHQGVLCDFTFIGSYYDKDFIKSKPIMDYSSSMYLISQIDLEAELKEEFDKDLNGLINEKE